MMSTLYHRFHPPKSNKLFQKLDHLSIYLLIAGTYTPGIIFYVLDSRTKLRHAHGIWHLFVLSGSICHFISIVGYVR
jgi:predicted membrane channel-forming protein YqfA (hemolysin III family)